MVVRSEFTTLLAGCLWDSVQLNVYAQVLKTRKCFLTWGNEFGFKYSVVYTITLDPVVNLALRHTATSFQDFMFMANYRLFSSLRIYNPTTLNTVYSDN